MKQVNRAMLAAFAILLLVSCGSVLASDKGMSEKGLTLNGDLIRVDTDNHSFVVRGSDQKEITFSYDDKTEISGAGGTIEGLAGSTGTSVTVYYKQEGTSNVATKVEVHSSMKSY